MRRSRLGGSAVDHQCMSFDASNPRVLDLAWSAGPGKGACCDLCRTETQLFRLLYTVDALCASCFGMWHG